MILVRADEKDFAEVVELANVAYRKTGPGSSWNSEEGLIEGSRLRLELLREDLAKDPEARLLIHRDAGELVGTVWLEPKGDGVWYLGLLTVRPDRQMGGLGKAILGAAEVFVRERGGVRVRMTVLAARETLVAWYQRRGYVLTGETQPYPKADGRFGKVLREGLFFVVMEKVVG
ncbi:MAG: GNAT family N-acetyltransferase [Acidobacteriota bacterium]